MWKDIPVLWLRDLFILLLPLLLLSSLLNCIIVDVGKESLLAKQLSTNEKSWTTPSESKQENTPHNVEKSDQTHYSKWHECTSVSMLSRWHAQSVLFATPGHMWPAQSSWLSCACWCAIVGCVLCANPKLFIEIPAPCAASCVCDLLSDSNTLRFQLKFGKTLPFMCSCVNALISPLSLPQPSGSLHIRNTVSVCVKGSFVGFLIWVS